MRKLLAVTAVLASIAALCGCGGSSSHPTPAPQSVAEESENPGATNIAAFWFYNQDRTPFTEVWTFTGRYWVKSSAVSFITTPEGVRMAHAPETEIYNLGVWYAKREAPYHWDGEGLLPLTKTVTSISGEEHKRPLVKIKAYLFNERLGNAVPFNDTNCSGCVNERRTDDPPRSF